MPRRSDKKILVVSTISAIAMTSAVAVGSTPGPTLEVLDGGGTVLLVIFIASVYGARVVLKAVPRATYRWAIPFGLLFAVADLAGISLQAEEADLRLLAPSVWGAVHFAGTLTAVTLGTAITLHALDLRAVRPAVHRERKRRWTPIPFQISSNDAAQRHRGIALTFALLVASKLPVLLLWWPGLIFFDTYRSLSYARGIGPWESYEPVGHSLLIAAWQGIWDFFALSDEAALAFASLMQVLSTSAAFAFLLARLAVWGIPRLAWWLICACLALLPVLSVSSITVVKDLPFMSAFVVFMVALAEILRRAPGDVVPRWTWWALSVSGIVVIVMRNNGVYVVLASLLLLVVLVRRHRRRFIAALAISAAAFAIYAGPLSDALGVVPGPKTEAWSIPLQQIARIADDHHEIMADEDREFVNGVFEWWDVDEVGDHYVPGLSDPIKLDARSNWEDFSTSEFLGNWARLVSRYPISAATATLANTVGFWSPSGTSYDGIFQVSWNDVRSISLDIPDEAPQDGLRGLIEREDLLGERFSAIPVLGLTLSPGFITWVWLLGALILMRRSRWSLLAASIPAALLMATFLAGPVSGGMRYSLGIYATLPIVIGLVLSSAKRPGRPTAIEMTTTPEGPTDRAGRPLPSDMPHE